ncbi:hypothetical protein E1B28_004724 [Marasmius oreades]|uniref:Uncharacterized protein n=1 Tax=Marasmius oreades TaxID=181124 RepID=A0A9P7UZ73_9AGAR|nr:uncharacterized protein E1B28_004724 [Marasmius oreades]KAG7097374.1 hypothetical protein E1B28_004724 [Marasmius oreades]
MADKYSDILGAGTLPIGPKKVGVWSSLSFTTKSTLILLLLLASYVTFGRLWGAFWKWREREYKLSMRRKYGIPDNDHRPFNVAYAAAQLAREQRAKRRSTVQPPVQTSSSRDQRDAYSDSIRHRPASQNHPGPISEDKSYLATGRNSPHLSHYNDHHYSYNRVTFADGYNTSASPLDVHAELAPMSPSTRRLSDRKNLGILKSSNHKYFEVDQRKRALGGDDLDEQVDSKKSRVEGEELIDGDEEPEWQTNAHGRVPSVYPRGSKREFDQGDVRERDKRQRKISAEKMEVDEDADVVGDLVSVSPSRGRKRDRTEAGSTFGGDDDENVPLDEDHDNRSRHRKRRNKRTSDAHSGSRKRDRDLYDTGDFSDSNEDSVGSRGVKKKGKKYQQRGEDEKGSDVSMDESQLVRPTIKGRKIGEEWTSNGIKYKIGPNGQRLRETLLKKAKQRFVMPEDSMHPDRNAFHDVYVEAWLTDEEYQNFAAQGIIYEPPKELETPSSTSNNSPRSTPPISKGKHLLWESTITHPPTPPLANPFETARKTPEIPSNALISRSVGAQMAYPKNGRIASAFRGSANVDSTTGLPPSLADSTNSLSSPRAYRQYSKWEKQDLEAQAMMRMREANNKKKEEEDKLAHEKKEQEARVKTAITPAPTVPTISFTKPPEDHAKEEASRSVTAPLFSSGGSVPTPSTSTPIFSGTVPKSLGAPAPAGSDNTSPSVVDNKPKASSPLSLSFAPSSPNTSSSTTNAVSATTSGLQTSSAPSGKSQEANAAKPATPVGFSFAQPPSLSNKSQEGPKLIGLGFPSSATQPQVQPANSPFAPPATSVTVNPAAASTTTPKFNFGLPAKPAVPLGAESKETTPNTGGGFVNPLLARLSPASASTDSNTKPQNTSTQGSQPTPSASTTPIFSLTRPAPPSSAPSAPSYLSNAPTTRGQQLSETQTQQATPPSSSSGSSAPAPLKFTFGGFKGPTTNITSIPSTTSAPANNSSAATAESKSSTQNLSAFSKQPEGRNNTSATSVPKFSFGTPTGSNSGAATASTGGTFSFGGFGGTSSNGTTKGSPSPFGSTFGAAATPPATIATETKEQPTAPSSFGTGMTGSVYGNSTAPSAFGSGSGSSTSSPFASSNIFGSKVDVTPTTKNDGATRPSAFGNAGNTFNGFGAFGSKAPDSTSTVAAPKAAFVGFGGTSATASNGTISTPTATTSSPFGGSGFGASSMPGSIAFGSSSKTGEAPKFSFGGANTTVPPGKSDTTARTTFGGSTTSSETPVKSPFSFGAPPNTSGGSTGGTFPFGSSSSSSPFGGATGTAPAFGTFGGNNSTTNSTTPSSFSFGNTPSSTQSN